MPTITIDRRYRGPRESGNGGYAAGLLAQEFRGGVEVTLRKPPPLDRRLAVVRDAERAFLLDGEELVAEARQMEPALEPPEPPTEAEVFAAAAAATRWEAPDFADCFVCGTRGDGSGLEIHPGPVPGRDGIVAATWIAARRGRTQAPRGHCPLRRRRHRARRGPAGVDPSARGLTTLVLNQHERSSSPQFVRGVSATSRPPSSS
ncbi:MAG: hypothetical protein ACR2HI_10085 [Gaiella sp.]